MNCVVREMSSSPPGAVSPPPLQLDLTIWVPLFIWLVYVLEYFLGKLFIGASIKRNIYSLHYLSGMISPSVWRRRGGRQCWPRWRACLEETRSSGEKKYFLKTIFFFCRHLLKNDGQVGSGGVCANEVSEVQCRDQGQQITLLGDVHHFLKVISRGLFWKKNWVQQLCKVDKKVRMSWHWVNTETF